MYKIVRAGKPFSCAEKSGFSKLQTVFADSQSPICSGTANRDLLAWSLLLS
jgi:hypothetical protein